MKRDIESLRGTIAFGVITIREDEAEALLDRFEVQDSAIGRGDYDIGVVTTLEGTKHQFALVRCSHTGQREAQRAAHDLIEDLAPRLIFLVGIGGAVPSNDFTLGDVVCATRVHDFCVRAVLKNRPDELDVRGGPMHPRVERLLSRLPALLRKPSLEGWNSSDAIGCKLPQFEVPREGSDRYYGSDDWKKSVRESLEYHFPTGKLPRSRLVTARHVASSDALVKDTKTVKEWRQAARAIAAVEMELAAIYTAARGDTEVPILAVRGISDIVGFKREEKWTKFACHSAAAFAFALVKSGELDHLLQPAELPSSPIPLGGYTVPLQIIIQFLEDRRGNLRKQWRDLGEINYAMLSDAEHNRALFVCDLALALNQIFNNKGYTRFNGLIQPTKRILPEAPEQEFPNYKFVCHQVEFCTAVIQRGIKRLSDMIAINKSSQSIEDRNALVSELNRKELEAFSSKWVLNNNIAFSSSWTALEFIYDPAASRITIQSLEESSLNPADYPNRVGTTSELLHYIASLDSMSIGFLGDLNWYSANYPLMKLMIEVLDTQSFRWERIRINANDYEEWDYNNPSFDEEIGRYGPH